MLKTYQIIETIEDLKLEEQPLRLKKLQTGETLGLICNYVADENLFLFGHPEGGGFCQDFKDEVLDESLQDEWDDHAYDYLGLSRSDEKASVSEAELDEAKYKVVTNFPARIYLGEPGDCPIRHSDQVFEIQGFEVAEEGLYLLY